MSRALAVGELLIDRLHSDTAHEDLPGGAPANVAAGLAKAGSATDLVSCVGSDPQGDWLIETLTRHGVPTRGVQRHPTAPTRVVNVLRDSEGERSFGGFDGPTQGFADAHLSAEAIDPALLVEVDLLICGTLALASPASRRALLHCIRQTEAPVLLDVNWRPMFWPMPQSAPLAIRPLLHRVRWLKLGAEEAHWLLQSDDPTAIAVRNPQLHGVFVTDGPRGCHWWVHGHGGHTPSPQVEVVDTTGAGDAFVAALAHQLLTDPSGVAADPGTAVAAACAAGARATTHPGALGPA